jgi:hypothetical protein
MGGLTCFLAERLDRDAIFAAMRRRRHYATTGNRAFVSVSVSSTTEAEVFAADPAAGAATSSPTRQLLMGDIARVRDDEVTLTVEVIGSAAIERLDIWDGLEHLETIRPYGDAELGARIRLIWEGAEYRGRARTTTWDGSLSIDGNSIVRASVINNWNLERGIVSQAPDRLSWKAVTTGNYGGLDLWLERPDAGRLCFRTAPIAGELAIAELGMAERVFAAGGLARAIKLHRLPVALEQRHLLLRRRLALRGKGDTRPFVRVQQEDGHRMWSSPLYLFR